MCACLYVVTDGLDSERAGREDGSSSAPARARPTCGCTGRVSAPWPAFIFRAQSYIGMIANVRLISLSSAAGPIWISVRGSNAGDMTTHTQKRNVSSTPNKNPLCCVMTCTLHMQQAVAVALLWHAVMNKSNPLQTTHTRFLYKCNFWLDHLPRATPGCLYSCHTSLSGGLRISARDRDGKCRDQLYGDIHTILKGTHQCHVAVKRIIELARMSLRLGCNAYL